MYWSARASAVAEFHFDEEFNHRLIVDQLSSPHGEQVVYFWNNNPPKSGLTDRDSQVELVRQECAQVGMRQLAYVEHPPRGRDEGYSCIAVFEVPEGDSVSERRRWLLRICREIFYGLREP